MLPRPMLANADLTRLINSDEIQAVVRPKKEAARVARQKKNPLKNLSAMVKLNPYAATHRRNELKYQADLAKAKAKKTPNSAAAKKHEKAHRKIKAAKYANLIQEE